jgi:N6-L-threonylcarbamoyladenine synthase
MEELGDDELVVMGMEGSANKVGIGIVTARYASSVSCHVQLRQNADLLCSGRVLANPRHTFITPPGEGFQVLECCSSRVFGPWFTFDAFQPRETARHHQDHVLPLVHQGLHIALLVLDVQ